MSSKNAIDNANEKLLFEAENDKKLSCIENTKEVTIIAAAAENNALGKDNRLIWHIPEDLKRFKRLTSGHAIIMGRKTFESLPKALPNRHNIVISRNKSYAAEGASICHNLEEAMALAENDSQPFIIGGGQIYKLALEANLVDKIYLTKINHAFDGDTFFPELGDEWKEVKRIDCKSDEKHSYDYSFLTFEKIK